MTIRNELLEEILAATGGGGGGVPTPAPGVLADNEMVKANVGGTAIVGTGDTNSDTEVDFGAKDVKTTGTMTSGTGTFILGEAIATSAAGENITTTNLVSGEHFNPVWIEQTENIPKGRVTLGVEQELTQEASKADILINPSWQSDPIVDWRVVKLTFETDTTITNAVFKVTKGGADFYSARLGTLTANVEKTIDLTDPSTPENVPAEAFVGDAYIVSVSSVDGDVRLKGSTANALPFFKVGFFYFVDNRIADINAEDFGQLENPMSMMSSAPIGLAIKTGVERDGVSQPDHPLNSPSDTHLISITNENQAVQINGVILEHTGLWEGTIITLTTAQGSTTTVTTMLNNTNTITFNQSVIASANEVFTIFVDGSKGSSGGGAQTELRLEGKLDPSFEPYFQLRVTDVRLSQIDPDLRTQSRTIAVGYNQQGYQAQIGGGLIVGQGWVDGSTGTASLTPAIDPVDNVITLESRDNDSGGISQMSKPIDAADFQDLFDFGGQITYRVRSITEDGVTSASTGLGFSAASDPGWKGGSRGRWLLNFGVNAGGIQTFTPQGGTKVITGIVDDYIEVILVIPPGSMNTDIYVNGVFDQTYDFSTQGSNTSYDDAYIFGSGGTSAISRDANLRITELTTFTTSATLPFTKAQIELNLVGALPYGVFRDWVIIIPDDDVEFGSASTTQLSNYGSVTLTRAGDEVTFNGQDEMTIMGPGSFIAAQVNVDPDSPDKRYQIAFQGEASQTASSFNTAGIASPSFQRLERLALIAVRQQNSEDVTLNPDSVTNDTIQLVGQRIQAFLATDVKDGVMSKADKAKLDALTPNTERLSTIMSVDLVLSGSEQQIPFDPAQTSRAEDITVNAGGSFTIANDGYYTGALTLFVDKSGGAGANMSIWVEVKPLSTGIWELSSSAMSNPIIYDDGGQPVALTSSIDALAGDEFRVMILLNAGVATLTTESNTVALGSINNYAASLSVSKVGPVTP